MELILTKLVSTPIETNDSLLDVRVHNGRTTNMAAAAKAKKPAKKAAAKKPAAKKAKKK